MVNGTVNGTCRTAAAAGVSLLAGGEEQLPPFRTQPDGQLEEVQALQFVLEHVSALDAEHKLPLKEQPAVSVHVVESHVEHVLPVHVG